MRISNRQPFQLSLYHGISAMRELFFLTLIPLFVLGTGVVPIDNSDAFSNTSTALVQESSQPIGSHASDSDLASIAEKFYEKSEQLSAKTITLSETLVNALSIFLAIFFAFNALNVFQTRQIKKKNDEYMKLLQDEMSERKAMVDTQLKELENQELLISAKLADVQKIASSFDAQFSKAANLETRLDAVSKYLGENANNARGKLSKILENFSWKGDITDDKNDAYTEYYNLSEFVRKLGCELTIDDFKIRSIHCLINSKESDFMFNFEQWVKLDKIKDRAENKDSNENPYYVIGNTYRKLDNPQKALEYFNEAIKINPYNSKAWHFKTGILIKRNSQGDAIRDADDALRADPNNANAWYVKTLIYQNQEKYDEALESCNKAIELDTQIDTISIDEHVLYVKAKILVSLNRLEEAWQCAVKATETLPDNSQAYILQARILRDLGRYEEALHAALEAVKLAPTYSAPSYLVGQVYNKMKDYDASTDFYIKSSELDRTWASPIYNIACNYALKTNKRMALEFLAKAIVMNTKYKSIARGDEDFVSMWEDPEFKSVTS